MGQLEVEALKALRVVTCHVGEFGTEPEVALGFQGVLPVWAALRETGPCGCNDSLCADAARSVHSLVRALVLVRVRMLVLVLVLELHLVLVRSLMLVLVLVLELHLVLVRSLVLVLVQLLVLVLPPILSRLMRLHRERMLICGWLLLSCRPFDEA